MGAGMEMGKGKSGGNEDLAKAVCTHDPLFLSSIHLGHQDSLLYTHFSRTHPSSISSSIHCGTYLSFYLNISI
jgi:hypothetical protein